MEPSREKLPLSSTATTIRIGKRPDRLHGSAGSLINGIVVGSGINAESFEDFTLQTQIAHGTGAGQLSYTQCEAPVNPMMRVQRPFPAFGPGI